MNPLPEPSEEGQLLIAEAPLAEMFKYATDLRSMTQARGSFRMRLSATRKPRPDINEKIRCAGAGRRIKTTVRQSSFALPH